MRSKRLHSVLILALISLAVSLGRVTAEEAATEPAFPIAVCSMPQVFQDYVQTQDMLARLNALNSSLQTEQETRQAHMEERKQELDALTPGSEAHTKLAESLEDEMIELRIWQETQQARLRRQHRVMTERMYATIKTTIGEIAAERGIQMVLNRTEMDLTNNAAQQLMQPYVLYAKDAMDITTDVVRRLNERYTPQPSTP